MLKVWFVAFLLGKSAVVVGPLPYGVGECWTRGGQLIEKMRQQNPSISWTYGCFEMKRRPEIHKNFDELNIGP